MRYLDGALEPVSAAKLDEHLDGCPACRLLYANLAQGTDPTLAPATPGTDPTIRSGAGTDPTIRGGAGTDPTIRGDAGTDPTCAQQDGTDRTVPAKPIRIEQLLNPSELIRG